MGGSVSSGIAGAVDDIRHTFERTVYDREVTGNIEVVGMEQPEQEKFTMADFYGDPQHDAPSNPEPTQEHGMDLDNDIER